MSLFDVVCFGEVLWDVFEDEDRGDEPIARVFRRELGGALANVASGLARLGVKVALVGGIGRDRFGQALDSFLKADGVDTRFLVRLPNRTGLTFITRDRRGEPTFLFYRHESADVAVAPSHITPAMGRAKWIVVGSSTLMTPPLAAATHRLIDHGSPRALVAVDLNVRPHLWKNRAAMDRAAAKLAARAHLVKASDADLQALAGKKWRRWLERYAPRATWVVTRGSGVATAIGPHGEVAKSALQGRCVDATGAGDAFIAGTLATLVAAGARPGSTAWKAPATWSAVLDVGHRMGKKAISRPGAVTGLVDLEDIVARIHRARKAP
jgi:fructokinase